MLLPILTDTHLKNGNVVENIELFTNTLTWCIENGVSQVFHLGDIFDSRKAQTELMLTTFQNILDLYRQSGVVLVAIPGNHDKTDYGSVSSFLRPFIHHPGLSLIEDYYNFEVEEGIVLHFLPFFNDDEYNKRLDLLPSQVDTSKKNILLTHIGVTGSVMNNGMTMEGIPLKPFKIFDKVYIGHYHDYQVLDKGRIVYIASGLQHNFGETTEKGLFIVNQDFEEARISLGTKQYESIEVDIDKLTLKHTEEIRKHKQDSGNEVRVILVGSEEKIKAFNKIDLKKAGVAIQLKPTKIIREEVEERVEPFTDKSLYQEWGTFAKTNKLDLKIGKGYLDKVFNPTQTQQQNV